MYKVAVLSKKTATFFAEILGPAFFYVFQGVE